MSKPSVFISYSHKDEAIKDRLLAHLSVLEHSGQVEIFDTSEIPIGDKWSESIENAIDKAAIALLVISAWGVGVPVITILLKETPLHPRLESLQYLDFTNRAVRPWDKLIYALKKAISKKKDLDD
jgi:hypothetical protein